MENIDVGGLAANRPNLVFEEGSNSIPDLLDSHLLPVVAQYDTAKHPLPPDELNFDLSQPLLLYKKRNIQKVTTRSLYIENGRYEEVGETLLIPEDYKGWFAVLQRVTGNIQADDTVPHFKSVEEVANSNTDRFLVGGTKQLTGFHIHDGPCATAKREPRDIMPGDLLTNEKPEYGEVKKRSRLFRRPKYITEKFLLCRDEADRKILLPFEQKGIFYQVSHKSGKAQNNVLQMSDIVARKLTPRILKLVFGRFPITPRLFTGLMKAESASLETSIIASTIVNNKNILMEIPMTSSMYFRVAVMTDDLRQNPCFRSAMSLSAERAITYMRNIKVCYNFAETEEEAATSTQVCNREQSKQFPKLNAGDEDAIRSLEYAETPSPKRQKRRTTLSIAHQDLTRGRSAEKHEFVCVRPARALSTGRMSFCLGNSYLTLPLYEDDDDNKRYSGNNNTFMGTVFENDRDFNKSKFIGEESSEHTDDLFASVFAGIEQATSMSCFAAGSYDRNTSASPDKEGIAANDDYIPVSRRRPTTSPPEISPPPVPRSTSSSGVSSGSTTSVSDGAGSNRGSTDSFEYAVPKMDDPHKLLKDIKACESASKTGSPLNPHKPVCRLPSTTILPTMVSTLLGCENRDLFDNEVDASGRKQVYENLKSLMELAATLNKIDSDNEGDIENNSDEENDKEIDKSDGVISKELNLKEDNNMGLALKEANGVLVGTKMIEPSIKINIDPSQKETNQFPVSDENTYETHEVSLNLEHKSENVSYSNMEQSCQCIETTNNESSNMHKQGDILTENVSDKQTKQELFTFPADITRGLTVTTEKNIQSDENSNVEKKAHVEFPCEVDITDGLTVTAAKDIQSDVNANECHCDFDKDSVSGPEYVTNTEDINKDSVLEQLDNTKSANESGVIITNNVRPSDSENLWRIAVRKMSVSEGSSLSAQPLALVCAAKRQIESGSKSLSEFTIDDISASFLAMGIKESSINRLRYLEVDGVKLQQVVDGDTNIRDCLDGVNLVDVQKISMFIRGWRPVDAEILL